MTRIAVELVPRDKSSLEEELRLVKDNFPQVTVINIPDLLRFPLRSWDGCEVSRKFFKHSVPHIRAIDLHKEKPLPFADSLRQNNISEVLVIAGDRPQDLSKKIYPTTSIDLIKKFKREIPEIKVYAAIDQYRCSIREEYEYIHRKIEAGADGFFTQPFFDLKFMEMYADILHDIDVYWGVSPVMTEGSKSYWEAKNNVVFPRDFDLSLKWNQDFARAALRFAENTKTNVYFMPIQTDIREYLSGFLK